MLIKKITLTFTVVLLTACTHFSTRQPEPSQAAIASAHPIATEAGLQVLAAGGNAFDAAVAVAAVLGVVEPYSAGMGGGGFWLLHLAEEDRDVFVDARERAPLAAHQDLYRIDTGEVDRSLSRNGPLAAAIPGQAAAFAHITEKYGKLSLQQNLARAIEVAQDGFPANEIYRRMAGLRSLVLLQYEDSKTIFLDDFGAVPAAGTLIKQPDLAQTMAVLAAQGKAGFYQGDVARKLVESVRANGGIWTLQDLENYSLIEREPLRFKYQNYEIVSAPPPSSGGIALAQIFQQLAVFDLPSLSAVDATHLISETMRRAYRDRAEFLGDPDYYPVPVERLMEVAYAQQLAASINMRRATPSAVLKPVVSTDGGTHTTHFSVLDRQGNRVAATLSINLPFGSGFVAKGTGVLLNDEMDDFSAAPLVPNAYGLVGSVANSIEPGKRPLSSMTPTFIESDQALAILGTPGGSRIITMVLLGALEMMQGKPVEEWVSRGRFHHQYLPDVIQHEPGLFTPEVAELLQKKGHKLKSVGRQYGNMQAILLNKNTGEVSAAADPRGIGQAKLQ